jgi:hypothetical protein
MVRDDRDEIWVEVDGSTISVFHQAALCNCCADEFFYGVSRVRNVIQVEETEVLELPCDCQCCFDLAVEIEGVAPGEYIIDFQWLDNETWEWRSWPLEVTVPDVGQRGELVVGPAEASD